MVCFGNEPISFCCARLIDSTEANEPNFLRKLRNQQAGKDTDRHERQIARPKRTKADANDDDGPTYVGEDSNNTLSKEEYQALLAGKSGETGDTALQAPESVAETSFQDVSNATNEGEVAQKSQEIVEIGKNQKKRRAAKMIVADDENDSRPVVIDTKKGKKAKAIKLSSDAE